MSYTNNDLYQLSCRWEDFFSEQVPAYAFADEELDIAIFAPLIRETVEAILTLRPRVSTEGMQNWVNLMALYGHLKAYAKYPVIVEDDITLAFAASRIIAQFWCFYFSFEPENIFEADMSDFKITMTRLPDSYEKNAAGESYIPYDFATGDLVPLMQALKDGGDYWE